MCARLQLLSDRTVLNYPNKLRLSELLWLSHISITLDDSAESSDFRLVVLLRRESLRGSRRGTFIILPVGHNSTQYLTSFHTLYLHCHIISVPMHCTPLMIWIRSDTKVCSNSYRRGWGKHTQTRSCVITTSACWQAACRAEPGSRSAKSDLEERARLGGAFMSSLVQWAKRSSSLGRLCSITAKRRRPDSVMSGPSPGVGGGNGATNSFCSYLALIHDSRSSLNKQREKRRWWIFS